MGVVSVAELFDGSTSGVPSVAAIVAVLVICLTDGGVVGEIVAAKIREPLPLTGTDPRLSVQVEPGAVPVQLQPEELWAGAKTVLAGTVSALALFRDRRLS